MWLHCRQVWMLSKLAADKSSGSGLSTEKRAEVLAAAKHGAEFLAKHAMNEDKTRVYFSLTADGKPASLQRKLFSECFFVMAMCVTCCYSSALPRSLVILVHRVQGAVCARVRRGFVPDRRPRHVRPRVGLCSGKFRERMRGQGLSSLRCVARLTQNPAKLGKPVLSGQTPSSPLNVPMSTPCCANLLVL